MLALKQNKVVADKIGTFYETHCRRWNTSVTERRTQKILLIGCLLRH